MPRSRGSAVELGCGRVLYEPSPARVLLVRIVCQYIGVQMPATMGELRSSIRMCRRACEVLLWPFGRLSMKRVYGVPRLAASSDDFRAAQGDVPRAMTRS